MALVPLIFGKLLDELARLRFSARKLSDCMLDAAALSERVIYILAVMHQSLDKARTKLVVER